MIKTVSVQVFFVVIIFFGAGKFLCAQNPDNQQRQSPKTEQQVEASLADKNEASVVPSDETTAASNLAAEETSATEKAPGDQQDSAANGATEGATDVTQFSTVAREVESGADSLRVEAYKSQRVQRHLRNAQKAFEKLAEEINKIVEKDEEYSGAMKSVDAPVSERQRNKARREAVERALQTPQIKKLKSEAKKHFEEFRRAYNAALEAKKAVK